MASPADSAPKAQGAFANSRLSPEEAERLAATFRPSWELDEAPFTGPGSFSASEVHALQGGGTNADVRAVAHATNGTHAPATSAASAQQEVENSVIIDRTITAQDLAQAKQTNRPGGTILGMTAPVAVQAAPQAAPAPAPVQPSKPPSKPPISRRPAAPSFNVAPPAQPQAKARPKAASVDLETGYPKKSKTGLWVGIAAAAALVLGGGIWLVASSSSGDEKAAAPVPTVNKPLEDKLSAVPPPPETAAAQTAAPAPAATTPPAAATTTVAAATLPTPAPAPVPTTPIPSTPVTSLPQAATPAPTHVAAVAPRPNYGGSAPAPAARPGGRKSGQTIVRDVPF
jgi:hypothetical protein